MPRKYDSKESKWRILSACVRLFIQKGYHSTTLAEILKEADVTNSTFQNIFHTKNGGTKIFSTSWNLIFQVRIGIYKSSHQLAFWETTLIVTARFRTIIS